jgi:glycosyltransferase involved in cell wall biosynthesis
MSWSEQVVVVIPCLNEGISIKTLVQNIRRYIPAVIVVDDGSSDRTAEEARAAGAQVLSHPTSFGKGAALATGFSAALRHGFDWVLAMDGDGQHTPSDIPSFLALMEKTTAAIVVGNRMERPQSMPRLRRIVNRWMSRQLGRFCETALPDSQCGFRMVNLHSWSRLQFTANHFEVESELIVRFLKAGYGIEFVPVQTVYGAEKSKIRPFQDTIRWLKWWSAIRKEMSQPAPNYVTTPQVTTPQDATA